MQRRTAVFLAAASCLSTVFVIASGGPALAHEERDVGKYHFAVGFGSEPAYTGQENSVQLFLHDSTDKPVTDLGDTLKVEVIYGTQSMTLSMEPFFEVGEFGIPGDYRAWFFPTQPGDYTFHFTGTVKDQSVDERFTSGSSTFSSVEDPTGVEFPTKVPPGTEIAARIAREIPRLNAQIAAAKASADDRARSARTVAVVALAVGAAGFLVGAVGMVRARRPPRI